MVWYLWRWCLRLIQLKTPHVWQKLCHQSCVNMVWNCVRWLLIRNQRLLSKQERRKCWQISTISWASLWVNQWRLSPMLSRIKTVNRLVNLRPIHLSSSIRRRWEVRWMEHLSWWWMIHADLITRRMRLNTTGIPMMVITGSTWICQWKTLQRWLSLHWKTLQRCTPVMMLVSSSIVNGAILM